MEKTGFLTVFTLLIAFFYSCAKQLPPPGGPVDRVPPTVVDVIPHPNETQVDVQTRVELTFSERIDRKSAEGAIFISPRPSKAVTFKWKGKRLIVQFPEPLKPDVTYVLTVGTDVRDLRRNRMKQSFQLAFSTGEQLDKGSISGRIYGKSRFDGIMVAAYRLNGNVPLEPSRVYPTYITQCDEQGTFLFSYLAPGNYRVFVITDKNGDQKYQHSIESIGVPMTDVEISESDHLFTGMNFFMTQFDTIAPGLKFVKPLNNTQIQFRFNEPVKALSEHSATCVSIVSQSDSCDTLVLKACFQYPAEPENYFVVTNPQSEDTTYILRVKGFVDMAGNIVDSTRQMMEFIGTARQDTSRPRLLEQSIRANEQSVPFDRRLQLKFSEPLDTLSLEQHLSITDSSNNHVSGTFYWHTPMDVTFKNDSLWQGNMQYLVSIQADSVVDLHGNTLADSLVQFRFTTVNPDTLSALSGRIDDPDPQGSGRFYVTAIKVGRDSLTYHTTLDSAGIFRFNHIMPGVYLLQAFRDSDNNGAYSHGSVSPFVPAERFVVLSDSIAIRSRWPNEGNDLQLPNFHKIRSSTNP